MVLADRLQANQQTSWLGLPISILSAKSQNARRFTQKVNTKTPRMRSFYARQARQAWVLPGGCSQHSDRSLKRFELPKLYQQVLYLSLG